MMESLLFPRLIFIFIFIFIFTFFSIVCNPVPVHGFDIYYLSPDSSATSQSGSSAIYFSYDSESDSISSYGATDNQRSLQSISATTENSDGISETQFSKSLIHSVLKANSAAGATAKRPVHKAKPAAGGTAKRPVHKAKPSAAGTAKRPVHKAKPAAGATAKRPVHKAKPAAGRTAKRPVHKAKPGGGGAANRELRKICSKTENPSLCVSTVAPRLRGGGVNARAVLDICIKASYDLAKTGAAKVKKLGIKECKGSFNDALYNFDLAVKAFRKKDVGTMNSMLSAVVTDMSDCHDKLSGSRSPLITLGDKLATMTSNCLLIIPQMH